MLSQDSVRLRQWLEMAPDAFVLSDAEGQILFANSQTERLFGHERDELSGQNLMVLIPDRYHHRHREYVRAYHSKPEVRMMATGRELIGRRKDGNEIAVDIALSPIRVEDGDCVLAAIRDMTLWKQAEAQIRDHAQRLEDSNQNLKAFACVASHDLQAPLRQIRTLCELLEDHGRDNLDEHARTLVGHISGCANRLSALVNNLLAHSRIDATRPTFEPVDCSELLACILQDFETPIHENHAVV